MLLREAAIFCWWEEVFWEEVLEGDGEGGGEP